MKWLNRSDKADTEVRALGADPNEAFCTECSVWYKLDNDAAVAAHDHR